MSTWKFDPAHTSASFSVRHMMVTTVRGYFEKVGGTLVYDPANPAASYVEAEIDAASINTGVTDRDNHLRSADFLDAANYPKIVFKSRRIELKGDDEARVYGDLTIRGVTREVVIDAELLGITDSPFGDRRIGFHGVTKINREDWGLTWNVALEAGGVLVGRDVKIELDVEAILVTEQQPSEAASAN